MDALPDGLFGLALRTPTLPPATATNTLIVGEDDFVVIEPASPHGDEQDRLILEIRRRLAAGANFKGLLITHHHSDHIGSVVRLRDEFGVPVFAHLRTAQRVSFRVDHTLQDEAVLELAGGHNVRCLHTPGHAPGHLVYLHVPSGIAHGGDMVAGEGTILIDPDDAGDMAAYLDSLERMRAVGLRAIVPAHGPVLDDPEAVLSHYVAHRLAREAKVMAALSTDPRDLEDLVSRVYSDTPKLLWPLARQSLRAHLAKLEAEDRVTARRQGYSLMASPPDVPQ